MVAGAYALLGKLLALLIVALDSCEFERAEGGGIDMTGPESCSIGEPLSLSAQT